MWIHSLFWYEHVGTTHSTITVLLNILIEEVLWFYVPQLSKANPLQPLHVLLQDI